MTTKSAGRRDLLDQVIRANRPQHSLASLRYNQMIESVRSNSSLLSPRSFRTRSKNTDCRNTDRCVLAISRMSMFADRMIRSPYTWVPEGEPIHCLSKHLFTKYEIPEFLHRAWFGDLAEIRILLDMARGVNPRKAVANSGSQSRLSRKAAHCFANAPDRFGVSNTIRWAQAVAIGAGERLADRIVKASEGYQFAETFWLELLQFLIYASTVKPEGRERSIVAPDDDELTEIVRFVWRQKYLGASRVLGYRVHDEAPLQPEFSFRGRTLRSFRRHMENWRNEVDIPIETPIEFSNRNRVWMPSGFKPLRVDDDGLVWQFVEILESVHLRVEGGKMRHCVASYEGSCRSGRVSIWSLRRCVDSLEVPVVTIEVWPGSRRIVQAKAKLNHAPTQHSISLIRRWANMNGLEMFGAG